MDHFRIINKNYDFDSKLNLLISENRINSTITNDLLPTKLNSKLLIKKPRLTNRGIAKLMLINKEKK